MTGRKVSRRSAMVALAAAPVAPTFANRISPAPSTLRFDLVVGEFRQATVEAPDVSAALAHAAGYRQSGDDVAVWLDTRLVGIVNDSGAVELGRINPPSPVTRPRPKSAVIRAMETYLALWREYLPISMSDDLPSGLVDRLQAAHTRAVRMALTGRDDLPVEDVVAPPVAFEVDGALMVVAADQDMRDLPVGSRRGPGTMSVTVVEAPAVFA